MPFVSRRTRPLQSSSLDSSERSVDGQGTRGSTESTKAARRLSQLVHKSKMFFSFAWIKSADEQPNVRVGNRRHSSSILDLMQPRPSLSTDRISRPMRAGSRPGIRSSQQRPYSRQFSRSEFDLRPTHSHPSSSRPRPSSLHPPRFGSVVRTDVPRYSTHVRPTHSTVLLASEISYHPNSEGLLVVSVDGFSQIISFTDGLPPLDTPPVYSRFDPGLPRSHNTTAV